MLSPIILSLPSEQYPQANILEWVAFYLQVTFLPIYQQKLVFFNQVFTYVVADRVIHVNTRLETKIFLIQINKKHKALSILLIVILHLLYTQLCAL